MKAIKSLLAISVLTAAGAANAATVATYDWSMTGVVTGQGPLAGFLTGTISGSGTGVAVLDDSGTLTLSNVLLTASTNLGGTHNSIGNVVFTGTYAGGVFTPTAGTRALNCTGPSGPPNCSVVTLDTFIGSINLAGGSFTDHFAQVGSADINETNTFSAVPVPAAAWVFGSGLLGLAGTARRRKTV